MVAVVQKCKPNPIHVCLEVSPIIVNGPYSKESMDKIVVYGCNPIGTFLRVSSIEHNRTYI